TSSCLLRSRDQVAALHLELAVKHHILRLELLLDFDLAELGEDLDLFVVERDRVSSREEEAKQQVALIRFDADVVRYDVRLFVSSEDGHVFQIGGLARKPRGHASDGD